MTTSSIFHNVVINDPKKADAFISAIDASIADPYRTDEKPAGTGETDPDKLRHIIDLWKKKSGD